MTDGISPRSDKRLRGEGELTAQLIKAAHESERPLSQREIDEVLGVDPLGEHD
jgi:hypothetical protein